MNEEIDKQKQYVIVPTVIKNDPLVNYKVIYVYAKLRRYMNKTTHDCFPSLHTLSKDTGMAINTLKKYLDLLETNKHIKIYRKQGSITVYKFNIDSILYNTNFERFTYEFLDNKLMTHDAKGMFIYLQSNMYKDDRYGKLTSTYLDLSEMLGCSMNTLKKTLKNMEDNNILTISDTKAIDPKTKTKKKIFNFDFEIIGQAVLFKLKDHEDRISDNESEIKYLKEELLKLKNIINDKNHYIKIQDENINELKKNKREELKREVLWANDSIEIKKSNSSND